MSRGRGGEDCIVTLVKEREGKGREGSDLQIRLAMALWEFEVVSGLYPG
jgi:hypothetical protein